MANFALRKTAQGENCSKDTKNAILTNFYVDDLLISESNEEKAIKLTQDVKTAVAEGGFNLTSFNSNSKKVLKYLNASCDSACREIAGDPPAEGRALGVFWKVKEDKFSFQVGIRSDEIVTKRTVLKNIASIYDPIGSSTPVLIPAKRVFQEACRLKLQWDDTLPSHLHRVWLESVKNINELTNYEIPRCMRPAITIELNTG